MLTVCDELLRLVPLKLTVVPNSCWPWLLLPPPNQTTRWPAYSGVPFSAKTPDPCAVSPPQSPLLFEVSCFTPLPLVKVKLASPLLNGQFGGNPTGDGPMSMPWPVGSI